MMRMAAALVKACAQISSLRQPLIDIAKRDQVREFVLLHSLAACFQCQDYHTTAVCFKQKKKEAEKEVFVKPNPRKALPAVNVWSHMSVEELATSAKRSVKDVIDVLSYVDPHVIYRKNTFFDKDEVLHATVTKLGYKVKRISNPNKVVKVKEDCDIVKRAPPDESVLVKRHPVVTIMGHVDHGKTTLLDALRSTSVVDTEFGGITQHIGAFNVTLKTGERMTFLDTPGHAAFSAMRARGAQVTDIVVLVVAADDGVMEQTIQSIEMAKSANVPIIVAINKIDKPEADIKRTQQMLAQQGIIVEELGGDIQCVNISALKQINLDTLTETIALQAELAGLKGDPTGPVEGAVIECSTDPRRGKLATVLIQRGTLKKSAVLVCGTAWAKVRAMFDHSGTPVTEAKLSEAVQIIGWRALPEVGDEILEVESERQAQAVIRFREARESALKAEEHKKAADKKLEQHLTEYKAYLQSKNARNRYRSMQTPKVKEAEDTFPKVNVIVKGDVAGSVEAILDVFDTYTAEDKCRLSVVHYDVGAVSESDIEIAETFKAIIYPFNVNIPPNIAQLAKEKGVPIRPYNIIYKLIDDVKARISEQLPPVFEDEIIGQAEVLQEFEITEGNKKVRVAGCRCVKGVLKKSAKFRLLRNGEEIYTGHLASMRHLKEEVNTIKVDVECGLKLGNPTIPFKPGDTIICFMVRKKEQKIKWDPGF